MRLSSLVQAAPVKVKQTQPAELKTRSVTKYEFTGRKQDRYAEVSWDWLVKLVKNWKASNKPKLEVKVLVWDQHDKPQNQALGQEFLPDPVSVRGAITYAKKLIADGTAIMTEVVGLATYSFSSSGHDRKLIATWGTWEPEE